MSEKHKSNAERNRFIRKNIEKDFVTDYKN